MKYLRQNEVCEMLRISDSSLTSLRQHSDFPEGIKLGHLEILVWIDDEIHEWVKGQPRKKTIWSE